MTEEQYAALAESVLKSLSYQNEFVYCLYGVQYKSTSSHFKIDLPDAMIIICATKEKVGTVLGVHERNLDGLQGRFLLGYHWLADGLLGPYFQN